MPRDQAGAPAPLSPLAQRLETLQRCRRRDAQKNRKARRFYMERLEMIEHILARIIDGADFIGDVRLPSIPPMAYPAWVGPGRPGVALLVTLTVHDFNNLAVFGADVEDMEDTGDGEPSLCSDEQSIDQTCWGSGAGDKDREGDDADDEPSLGSCDGIMDQERWHDGSRTEAELDCDRERDIDNAQVRAADRVAAGKPEDTACAIRKGNGKIVIRRDKFWGSISLLEPRVPLVAGDRVVKL